jgi:hypothetical protein
MSRPKGSGAIKSIDSKKQDSVEIRNLLHGGEPTRDADALRFIHWHGLVAQRADCVKRLKAGQGTKWTRKRLKQLNREIDDKWRELGVTLGALSDGQLSEKLAILSKAARPPMFPWQVETTRLVEINLLLDRSTPGSKTLQLHGKELNLTARQLHEQVCAEGYNVSLHDLRQFVLRRLNVTFQSERGKRTDLGK